MLINNIVVSVSEMASYPIGVTMLIDKPENFIPPGALINDFADCDYDTQCTIDFENLPFYEINSLFPMDFRLKSEILQSPNNE